MDNGLKRKLISVFGNSFDKSDVREVERVLRSHLVGTGEVTEVFENEFKQRIGFNFAAAVSSCTNGFWLLLKALEFEPGDEIIIPNIHFFGIKNVIELLNIKYKIVDVGKPVPNITLKEARANITGRTRAIIFLEYGGYPVQEMENIKLYLKDRNLNHTSLILDAANSPFTRYLGEYSALSYDYVVYSFDMNKILVTGDGGMVLSNNHEVINKVKALSYYGIVDVQKTGYDKSSDSKEWWKVNLTVPSLKLGMNNIAASLGLTQLGKIDRILEKRTRLAEEYFRLLKPLESKGLLELPPAANESVENNVYFFWLKLVGEKTRNKMARYLLSKGIYSTVKYQPLDRNANTPNALEFFNRALDIPFNQNITREQQRYIIKHICEFFNNEN